MNQQKLNNKIKKYYLRIITLKQLLKQMQTSTRNHTKNELARISAKIQQLKKKYPASSELYLSQEKKCQTLQHPALQQIKLTINNEDNWNQRVIRPKSISYGDKTKMKNQIQEIKQNLNNFEESLQKSSHGNSFYQGNDNQKVHEFFSQIQSSNESFERNLIIKQKPFKQYKQDLKNLKKQILSGLDITNFSFNKHSIPQNSQTKNQNYNTFSKKLDFKSKLTLNKENQNHSNQPTMKQIQQYKNRLLQNRKKNQITQNPLPYNEFLEMKEIFNLLISQIQIQKLQFQERLTKLQLQTHSSSTQNEQTKKQLQIITEKLQQLQKSQKISQFDLKIVEIQNQSISKLSKDLYNQIETINIKLNNFQQSHSNNQSLNSVCQDKINQTKEIEEIVSKLLQTNKQKNQQVNNNKIKDMECRFFKQIFNLQNQLLLVNEKMKKQDYLQKTLKSLLPSKSTNNEEKIDIQNITNQVKSELSKNLEFLDSLKKIVEQQFVKKIPDISQIENNLSVISNRLQVISPQIQQKILRCQRKVKEETNSFVLNELSYVFNSLRQFETKMTSYGILIEHLEEGIRQISTNKNLSLYQNPFSLQSNEYIKQGIQFSVQKKSNLNDGDKVRTKSFQTQSLTQISNNYRNEIQSEQYINSQLDNSKVSNLTMPYCVNSEIHKSQNQFFITKFGQTNSKQVKNNPKGFLLEDLVKNSLVFSALNN